MNGEATAAMTYFIDFADVQFAVFREDFIPSGETASGVLVHPSSAIRDEPSSIAAS